jgi:hypothetical protein
VVVDFGDGPETFLVDEFCGGPCRSSRPHHRWARPCSVQPAGRRSPTAHLEVRLRPFSSPSRSVDSPLTGSAPPGQRTLADGCWRPCPGPAFRRDSRCARSREGVDAG